MERLGFSVEGSRVLGVLEARVLDGIARLCHLFLEPAGLFELK